MSAFSITVCKFTSFGCTQNAATACGNMPPFDFLGFGNALTPVGQKKRLIDASS
jgi:hypothetical protein